MAKMMKNYKIYIAPMSGITDYSYRQILKKFHPDLMYTEMVNSTLFTRENEKTLKTIMRMSKDENTGIQLFGSDMDELFTNFCKLHEMGYHDLLLNMGCPKPKILKNGSGAGLLDRIDDIDSLLTRLNREKIKVSLKIRLCDKIDEYFALAYKQEIPYLCVHARSLQEKFESNSHFEEIKRLSKLPRNFEFIANGGIYSLEDFKNIQDINIDGIMLARGIIGNPWLISEIQDGINYTPTLDEIKSTLIEHIQLIKEDKGEKKAVIEINKFLEHYFKNFNINYTDIMLEMDYAKKIEYIKRAI